MTDEESASHDGRTKQEEEEDPPAVTGRQREFETTEVWTCGRPVGPYQGTFPYGFLSRVNESWPIYSREVLFPFGGATPDRENWTVNDINEDLDVDTHHDARDLPESWIESFDVVLSDPPYSEEYANELYDVEHPGYKDHFIEAERVLRPGGWLLILDWICYENYSREVLERHHSIAITCGPNTRIRNLNVFRKRGSLDPRGTLTQWSGSGDNQPLRAGSDSDE